MRRDDALWATACFAGGLVLLAAGVYVRRATPDYLLAVNPHLPATVPAYLLAGPLLVTCLGVAVRRTYPVAALVLGLVAITVDFLLGYSVATIIIFTDNLYAATLYGPARLGRWLLGVASALAVAGGAVAWVSFHDVRSLAMTVVELGLIGITPVSTGLIVRQLRNQAESERARAEQVARLAELDRRAAVDAERTRMARELHDMIANHFSAIAIQSTAVLSREDLDARTVRGVVESIRENSVQGMAEMRGMIGLLRQDGEVAETTRRRVAEADRLVARAREAGLEVRLRTEGEVRELPAAVDLAGYRIVQESLTNALKHGDGSVDLVIGYRPGVVTFTADNPLGDTRRKPSRAGQEPLGMLREPSAAGWELSDVPETLSGVEREFSERGYPLGGAGREPSGVERMPSGRRHPLLGAGREPSDMDRELFVGDRGDCAVGEVPHGGERRSPGAGRRRSEGRQGSRGVGRRLSDGVGQGSPATERALPSAGAGIIGMRERVALLGGAFEAGPYDDGWRVHAELPTGEIS